MKSEILINSIIALMTAKIIKDMDHRNISSDVFNIIWDYHAHT